MEELSRGTPANPFTEIRILTLHTTRGANYWSHRPVTRMDLDIGAFEDISSADVSWMTDQLVAALPGLEEHRCSVGTRGGFIQRLRRGTYAAHIIEHVALELQSMIGHEVGYGRTRGTGVPGCYTLAFAHVHEMVGLRAAALALETVQRAFAGTLHDVDLYLAELRTLAEQPTPAPLRQTVWCGVTGSVGRALAVEQLVQCRRGDDVTGVDGADDGATLVIDVAPSYILEAGLPYSHSDVAVILDANLLDVPDRYRDPERAARLVSVLADAVPSKGPVIAPSDATHIHEWVRDAGRDVMKFSPSSDIDEHVRRAVAAVHEVTLSVRHAH